MLTLIKKERYSMNSDNVDRVSLLGRCVEEEMKWWKARSNMG